MSLGKMGRGFGRLSLLSGGGGGFDLVRDVFGGGAYDGLYYDSTHLAEIGGLAPMWTSAVASQAVVEANGDTIGLTLSQDNGPTLGAEIAANNNLSGFVPTSGLVTELTNSSFTTSAGGVGVTIGGLTIGEVYRIDVSGTSNATLTINTADAEIPTARTEIVAGVATRIFRADRTYVYLRHGAAGTTTITNVSIRRVFGNHAYQSTSGSRGTWSSDGYWLGDGSDDHLVTSKIAAATATLAYCGRMTGNDNRIILGAQDGSSSNRCWMQITTAGVLAGGVGAQNGAVIFGGSGLSNVDHIALMRFNGTTVELWLNGARVYQGAQSGVPTTINPVYLGCVNNNGTAGLFAAGCRLSRCMEVDRYLPDNLILPTMRALGAGIVSI